MDIMVEGSASEFFTPERVRIIFNFSAQEKTYEKSLEEGIKSAEIFITDILPVLNLAKKDMKTKRFSVSENIKYEPITKQRKPDGYIYKQEALVRFDYDTKVISEFITKVSKLKNPPSYRIEFEVKDAKECKKEVIRKAYIEAEERAQAIANAANKKLIECVKTSFMPFEERIISNSRLMKEDMCIEKCMSAPQIFENIFTPEDIEIKEKIYCLWRAE